MNQLHFTLQPRERLVVLLALLIVVAYGSYLVGVSHGKAAQRALCVQLRQSQMNKSSKTEPSSVYQAECLGIEW